MNGYPFQPNSYSGRCVRYERGGRTSAKSIEYFPAVEQSARVRLAYWNESDCQKIEEDEASFANGDEVSELTVPHADDTDDLLAIGAEATKLAPRSHRNILMYSTIVVS